MPLLKIYWAIPVCAFLFPAVSCALQQIRAETELEHVTQDAETDINRLKSENQLLSAKVELYSERLNELNTEQAVDIATANLRKQV
jgi:hypothetical protein